MLAALAATLSLGACSESKKAGPAPKPKPTPDKDEPEQEDDGTEEQVDELSLEDVLKQCGVSTEDLDDPDKVVFEKTIRSFPKVFTGQQAAPIVGNVNYRVAVTTVVTIRSTVGKGKQTTDFEIEATPSKAEGPAREKTAPNSGTTETTTLSTEDRAALMDKNSEWDGIFCTIQPVRELSTNKGGKSKVIEFDPPLPMSISPKADAARYVAEIGQGRTFTGIKAKVVGSSDPDLPQGQSFEGSVKITPVSSTLKVNIGKTGSKNIKSDVAFRVEFNFGSVAKTVALGLMPMQTMYITHSDRDIKAIVADTGFEEGGTVVLVDGI